MLLFFSSRRRHTRYWRDWSSDVCSSDLLGEAHGPGVWSGGFGRPTGPRSGGSSNSGPRRTNWTIRRSSVDRGDRKSVVEGKSVDLGGRRIIKKKYDTSAPTIIRALSTRN